MPRGQLRCSSTSAIVGVITSRSRISAIRATDRRGSCCSHQPSTSIVLHPPATDPGITDDERRTIVEMMAKGTYAMLLLATKDLDGAFERLQASGAEVVQEPTEQPYGVRDCAFRDPAGNMLRIQELR